MKRIISIFNVNYQRVLFIVTVFLIIFIVRGFSIGLCNTPIFTELNIEGIDKYRVPPSDLEYFYLESRHFRVIYPRGNRVIAEKTLSYAESAYRFLSELSGIDFSRKIEVVLDTKSDSANGFVKLGSDGFYIELRPVIISRMEMYGLDWYTDWYRMLILHELSHIFHLETAGGLPLILRKVFGHIIYPNSSMPPFYIEGFATFVESISDSSEGRLNSPVSLLYFWSLEKKRKHFTPDRAFSDLFSWPGWVSNYLYGGSFVRWLAKKHGVDSLFKFNDKTGSLPFLLWPLSYRKTFESSIKDDWSEWLDDVSGENSETKNILLSEKFKPVSPAFGFVYGIAFSLSGRFVAYSLDPFDGVGGLYIYDTEKKKNKLLIKGIYPYDMKFFDEKTIGYIRSEHYRNSLSFNDIYLYDLRRGKEHRVTKGASIVAFSPQGSRNKFFALQIDGLGMDVVEVYPDGKINTLVAGNTLLPYITQIDSISTSPDGQKVAFSVKTNDGGRNIWILNSRVLHEGRFEPIAIVESHGQLYMPAWIDNNECFIISSEDGFIPLVYRINSGEPLDLSEPGRGIFKISISSDTRVAVCAFTSDGFGVYVTEEPLELSRETSELHNPARYQKENGMGENPNSLPEGLITGKDQKSDLQIQTESALSRNSGYQAKSTGAESFNYQNRVEHEKRYLNLRWIFPAFWLPFYAGNGVTFGVGPFVSGYDMLDRNSYQVALVYDLFDQSEKITLKYVHRRSLFSAENLFIAKSAYSAFSFSMAFPLSKSRYTAGIKAGFLYENGAFGFTGTLSYDSEKWKGDWIGPESGLRTSLRYYHNLSGNYFGFAKLNFDVSNRIFRAGEARG